MWHRTLDNWINEATVVQLLLSTSRKTSFTHSTQPLIAIVKCQSKICDPVMIKLINSSACFWTYLVECGAAGISAFTSILHLFVREGLKKIIQKSEKIRIGLDPPPLLSEIVFFPLESPTGKKFL